MLDLSLSLSYCTAQSVYDRRRRVESGRRIEPGDEGQVDGGSPTPSVGCSGVLRKEILTVVGGKEL